MKSLALFWNAFKSAWISSNSLRNSWPGFFHSRTGDSSTPSRSPVAASEAKSESHYKDRYTNSCSFIQRSCQFWNSTWKIFRTLHHYKRHTWCSLHITSNPKKNTSYFLDSYLQNRMMLVLHWSQSPDQRSTARSGSSFSVRNHQNLDKYYQMVCEY